MSLSRRALLAAGIGGAAALAGVAATPAAPVLPRRPAPGRGRVHDLRFVAAERNLRLLGPDGPEVAAWTWGETLLPVVRVRLGDTIRAQLDNKLREHTAIHWHGLRIPSDMDGVPYVSQDPVLPGESFRYEFTPPDPGTFFFHPHCNEPGQVGRGLVGTLIVEGDALEPFDADVVLAYRDWRIDEAGGWLPFDIAAGASRAGTFGEVRTVNTVESFVQRVPAGGDVRLRVLNLDATRSIDVGFEGAEGTVIATDGHALPPIPLDLWRLGPGMRIDLAVRAPKAGEVFRLLDFFSAEPWPLGTFTAEGPMQRKATSRPGGLFAPEIPRADLDAAERLPFVFSAAPGSPAAFAEDLPADDPLTGVLLDTLCAGGRSFWAINKSVWPDDGHRNLPPPLARLETGRSYVFELINATPHQHPIHLHGHVFEVLKSSERALPRFRADTVMVQPDERIEIAFVAETGNWMFHCHVLEHLEHGMMGWVRST